MYIRTVLSCISRDSALTCQYFQLPALGDDACDPWICNKGRWPFFEPSSLDSYSLNTTCCLNLDINLQASERLAYASQEGLSVFQNHPSPHLNRRVKHMHSLTHITLFYEG